MKELQNQLEDAESNVLAGGKKTLAKLEAKIRELEANLDSELRKHTETQKNYRKVDRRFKELTLQVRTIFDNCRSI